MIETRMRTGFRRRSEGLHQPLRFDAIVMTLFLKLRPDDRAEGDGFVGAQSLVAPKGAGHVTRDIDV